MAGHVLSTGVQGSRQHRRGLHTQASRPLAGRLVPRAVPVRHARDEACLHPALAGGRAGHAGEGGHAGGRRYAARWPDARVRRHPWRHPLARRRRTARGAARRQQRPRLRGRLRRPRQLGRGGVPLAVRAQAVAPEARVPAAWESRNNRHHLQVRLREGSQPETERQALQRVRRRFSRTTVCRVAAHPPVGAGRRRRTRPCPCPTAEVGQESSAAVGHRRVVHPRPGPWGATNPSVPRRAVPGLDN